MRMRGSDELTQLYNSERRRRLLSQMPVCLHNPVRGELEPRRASRRRSAPTLTHTHVKGRSVSRTGGYPHRFPPADVPLVSGDVKVHTSHPLTHPRA